MYEIAISFVSCFILWIIWFLIAKSKNNRKQMIIATECCFACFLVLAWGPLCGLSCYGASALINYLKKSDSELHKEEKSKHTLQEAKLNHETTPTSLQDTVINKTGNEQQPSLNVEIFLWIFLGLFLVFFAVLIGFSIVSAPFN